MTSMPLGRRHQAVESIFFLAFGLQLLRDAAYVVNTERAVNGPKRHVLAGLAEEGLEIARRPNTSPEHAQSPTSAEEGYAPKGM